MKDFLWTHITLRLLALLFAITLPTLTWAYTPKPQYNDSRMAESADVLLTYLNGSAGALIMVGCGVAAIFVVAIGSKETFRRRLIGGTVLALISIASFITRSLVSTWFNDVGGLSM